MQHFLAIMLHNAVQQRLYYVVRF